MVDQINVRYVGFQAKALVREYSFVVMRPLNQTSEFTVTVGHEAFGPQRAKFQDGPAICSLRLHRELAAFANYPPQDHYHISEAELEDFRKSQMPKSKTRIHKPIAE